ncbi:hypothetical protein [Methyloceanibacter sp. wino2]|uniref:hypothetical protein n=1 Tax=Methyloceanibacter sp. wino2 TaxID=2170729 RepID=UPI000D3EB7B3|nr:hypothetical protein [Methyloceanibacter sp. wino2]
MTAWLVLISGCIEVLFGASAILAPALVVAGVGGTDLDGPAMALIRLLGVATLAVGAGALLGRTWAARSPDPERAYGLGSYAAVSLAIYNIVAAPVLLLGAMATGSSGLWGGGALHGVIALLFVYALVARR